MIDELSPGEPSTKVARDPRDSWFLQPLPTLKSSRAVCVDHLCIQHTTASPTPPPPHTALIVPASPPKRFCLGYTTIFIHPRDNYIHRLQCNPMILQSRESLHHRLELHITAFRAVKPPSRPLPLRFPDRPLPPSVLPAHHLNHRENCFRLNLESFF